MEGDAWQLVAKADDISARLDRLSAALDSEAIDYSEYDPQKTDLAYEALEVLLCLVSELRRAGLFGDPDRLV